jgi:UDP-glucuronate 4-epimerase
VVHLAAQAGVRYSLEAPHTYIDSNVTGTLNVLEGCRHNAVGHLVYASTSSVYGANTKMPFSVHDIADHPVSLYAATKRSNELMAHTYSWLFKIPTTGLRFFTVYGPWGRPDMALFLFTRNILEGKPIDVFTTSVILRLWMTSPKASCAHRNGSRNPIRIGAATLRTLPPAARRFGFTTSATMSRCS